MRRTSGLTLAGVLVLVALAALLLTLLLPLRAYSGRHDQLLVCRAHLQALHRAQADPKAATEAPPLGAAYWMRLASPPLSLVDPGTLRCPFFDADRPCDYRGPVRAPSGLAPGGAVGSDDNINHDPQGRQGGNVLRKSGDVVTVPADGTYWQTTVREETRF